MITRAAAAVVGVLCALGLLVWSSGSHQVSAPRPVGTTLGGAKGDLLRQASGTIWWVQRGCSVGRMEMPAGRIALGPAHHCHLWPSPAGRVALASQDDPESPRPPGSLALLGGPGLEPTAVLGVRSDAVSRVSWSADGSVAAFCVSRGQARFILTVTVSRYGVSGPILGRCTSTWSGMALVTADDKYVYSGNHRLPLSHLTAGRPLDYDVPAIAATPVGLAIVLQRRLPANAGPQPAMLAVVNSRGDLIRVDQLPAGPVRAIFASPDGAWLVVQYGTGEEARMLPLAAAGRPSAVPERARDYAFSPDGRFVAVALRSGLKIVDLRTFGSAAFSDVDATSLAWTQ